MEIHQVENLLIKTSSVVKQYEKIANLTGENFNIFRILGLTTNEVRTHSAFIAELLNPNGKHSKGDLLLKEFLIILKQKTRELTEDIVPQNNCEINFEPENAKNTEVEKWLGYTTDTDGGYIDILLTDKKNNHIIIENKIYAGDQRNQLLRYHKFYKNAPIIYLTLDGKLPTEHSTSQNKEVKEKIICISYKTEIITWLDNCKMIAVDHPILRETITQYIYLIKKLTGQTTNNKMKEEITDLMISNGNNFSASLEIANSVYQAKKKLLFKFAKSIETTIKKTDSEIKIDVSPNFGDRFEGIHLSLPGIENEYIIFSFITNQSDFYLEMMNVENGPGESKNMANIKYYKERLKELTKDWGKIENAENAWHGDWVCRYFKIQNQFNDSKTWANLADGHDDDIVNEVSNDLKKLIEIFREKHSIQK